MAGFGFGNSLKRVKARERSRAVSLADKGVHSISEFFDTREYFSRRSSNKLSQPFLKQCQDGSRASQKLLDDHIIIGMMTRGCVKQEGWAPKDAINCTA